MKTINRLASFIKADHRYVYLGHERYRGARLGV